MVVAYRHTSSTELQVAQLLRGIGGVRIGRHAHSTDVLLGHSLDLDDALGDTQHLTREVGGQMERSRRVKIAGKKQVEL